MAKDLKVIATAPTNNFRFEDRGADGKILQQAFVVVREDETQGLEWFDVPTVPVSAK